MEENKNTNHFFKGALCGALAMFIAIAVLTGGLFLIKENKKNRDGDLAAKTEEKLEALKTLIDGAYLYSDEVEDEALEDGIYKGYVEALGDPYSVYYNAEETKEIFESSEGEYSGIGVVFSQNIDTKIVTAIQVYDGPAKEAGVKVGDILYKVDGEDVSTDDLSNTVKKIRGEENTTVELTVLRGSNVEEVTMEIERRKIQVETVNSEMKEDNIGYIQITEFDTVTLEQFETALTDLESQGMEGLVVDLRANPGGNLQTVVDILDILLPEGIVVYTEDKYGKQTVYESDDAKQFTKPIAVLVDGNSASAAEIFAGAIQDYEMGPIVGTNTFGKGIVQQIVRLDNDTSVKLTVSEYFTPDGRSIHGEGIAPDVEVKYEYDETDMEADNQLDAAVDEVQKMLNE